MLWPAATAATAQDLTTTKEFDGARTPIVISREAIVTKDRLIVIDTFDYKVLARLMANGRATWAELAQELRLSAPAAADRVRRLEERGIIRGYTAVLDAESLGCALTAFIAVSLDHPRRRERFLEVLAGHAEIQECHHVAGDADYLLKVRCHGTRALEYLLTTKIKALPGVVRTHTTIVLHTEKETSALPLDGVDSGGDTGLGL